MTELLDAVDALTLPSRTKVEQDDGHIVTVELPSLLDQLDAAIRGTVGAGGTGALANERNMLNADSLYRALLIKNMVKEWARLVGIQTRPADEPGPLLRRWYVLYIQTPRYLEDPRFYINQLTKWATQIEKLFNPPRTRDLPDACPICDADTYWLNGHEYPRPLVISFHDGPTMIEDGKGMCRACEAAFGLRELSFAIEEKHAQKSA